MAEEQQETPNEEENNEWQPKIEAQKFDNMEFENMRGVVINQESQPLECILRSFCIICYLKPNVYQIGALPGDKVAMATLKDRTGWNPTQAELDEVEYEFVAEERSTCCVRCFTSVIGCPNYRPFKMTYKTLYGEKKGLEYRKEFSLGGCCCAPHKIEARLNGKLIGRIEENWNVSNWCDQFLEYILCCNIPYNIQYITSEMEYVNRYKVNVSFCLWGPHNNFCGSSPCRNNLLIEAYRYADDKAQPDAVGLFQKTYGKNGGFKAFSRWLCCKADNYIIEWPETATEEDKALYLGAALLIDYVFYENRIF